MDRAWLEPLLAEFPLYNYAFIRTDELVFSPRVRDICRAECPMYGATWACPPAVGSLEACRERATRFQEGLLLATVAEVNDAADLAEALATRAPHEEITRRVLARVRSRCAETLTLSTEACTLCPTCTYPHAPCRHPDRMFPCVESHGILVTDLAERHGIEFMAGGNVVTWFSLILYRESPGL